MSAPTVEDALRGILDASRPREERIRLAAQLSEAERRIREALEPLKDELRAEVDQGDQDQVIYEVTGARAVCVKSPAKIELHGATIVDLRRILGEHFERLFRVEERLHPNRMTRMLLTKLPPDLKSKAFSVLKETEAKTRISFQETPGLQEK